MRINLNFLTFGGKFGTIIFSIFTAGFQALEEQYYNSWLHRYGVLSRYWFVGLPLPNFLLKCSMYLLPFDFNFFTNMVSICSHYLTFHTN